ncbi:MAG: prepilin-type N-terminal cleavage/methylation domain-containing protein [Planctomycetaceae bacterium]|nr:prepilin-type N-terminal cleavage/methylation domain-containing protein [Planctomycetaceae bacterium]
MTGIKRTSRKSDKFERTKINRILKWRGGRSLSRFSIQHLKHRTLSITGFTLVELLAVIAIVSVLSVRR